ncbi:MAG: XdhC family protein [Inhella sp.]|jgi:xanthine dehydrogenase accessory factor|uniref:XdhC family protein n=1 Tax=Inhella sp. TaxID=1921806 RepID=UPI00391FB4CB
MQTNRPHSSPLGHDHEVLSQALAWRQQGHSVVLATVLSTFGGSPRPPGSMAAIRDDGCVVGSVSGGCVEDDLVHEVREGRWFGGEPAPVLRVFGAQAAEQARYRLPCNNTLRVALESHWAPEVVAEAVDAIERRRTVRRHVAWRDGASRLEASAADQGFEEDERGFWTALGPHYRALVVGASELGRDLTRLLLTLDFDVRVCDPRPEYADTWPWTDVPLSREQPDDWLRLQPPDGRTAVIAVSHDPKVDDLALLEALPSPAFYVGAIGSPSTSARRRARLVDLGLSPAAAERLHGPVGLNIGSRTPAEIAVSIAAHLIQSRRQWLAQPGQGTASPQGD